MKEKENSKEAVEFMNNNSLYNLLRSWWEESEGDADAQYKK